MSVILGKRVLKDAYRVPDEMLTESVAGAEYTIRIETKGVERPKETLDLISEKLKEKFGITVIYGEVVNNNIVLQVKTPAIQFVWSAVLVFLPQILSVIGVIVGIITVYLLVSSVPSWIYAVGAIGLLLVFGLPKIMKKGD